MDDDVIELSYSDDDDCFVLEQIINLEPIVVDLTKESDHTYPTKRPASPQQAPKKHSQEQQNHQYQYSPQQPQRHSQPQSQQSKQSQQPQPAQSQQLPFQASQQTPFHQSQQPHSQQPQQPWFQPSPHQPANSWSRHSPNSKQPQQQQQPWSQQQTQQQPQQSQPQQPTTPSNSSNDESTKESSQPQPEQQQPTILVQQTNNQPANQQSEAPQNRHHQQDTPLQTLSDHELLVAKKNLGNENYKKNLLNEAIRIYREASELSKKLGDKEMSATIHFNLAMTYDRLGSYNQAADECAVAVKLKSDYMKPHLKRAEIYERLHKYEEAVICWEYICELDQSNRDYAIRLARVREAAKRMRKKEPHELLGLHPFNFSREDLKKAYKKKALSHHPDRHPDADVVTKRIHEKLFKDASTAHSSIQLRFGYR